jgi:hypothetical protein
VRDTRFLKPVLRLTNHICGFVAGGDDPGRKGRHTQSSQTHRVRLQLRHHRRGEIITITALVIGLEVVPVYVHNRAVGQVGKGAGNRIG